MAHLARAKINLSGECGRRNRQSRQGRFSKAQDDHLSRFGTARATSDSVGEPAPGGPGEVSHRTPE